MISFQYENVWQSYNLLESKQERIKRIAKSVGRLFVSLSTFFCGYSIHGISFRKENPERKKAVNCNIGHAYPSVSHSVLDHEDDIVLILG